MPSTTKLKTGFDSLRVIVSFGVLIAGSAWGVASYVYLQKQQHREEISNLEYMITKIDNRLAIEVERRADNELLVMTLEGKIVSMEREIKDDRIRFEDFIYQLSQHVTDNRVIFSDLAAVCKASHK